MYNLTYRICTIIISRDTIQRHLRDDAERTGTYSKRKIKIIL